MKLAKNVFYTFVVHYKSRWGTPIGLKKNLQYGTEDLGRDGTGYLIIRRNDCMMGWGGGWGVDDP